MKYIYLDYAAATPLDSEVLASMQPYWQKEFYNPSAAYLAGRSAHKDLEAARAVVAGVIGSKPAEIIFTAGATEANNLVIQGVMGKFPKNEVLVSAIEHESVLQPARKYKCTHIPVDKHGVVKQESLKRLVNDSTVLVSVMLVNNEIGSIQPVKEIAAFLQQIRKQRSEKGIKLPIYLHTDAAQAPSYLDIHTARLGIELMSINGGKIYGPKQSGALYIRAGTELAPLILGGGQENGVRSGTENVAGDVGLACALKKAAMQRQSESERLRGLRQLFISGLQTSIPSVIVNGSAKHSTPHIVSAIFPNFDNERLMMELDEAGIQAAVGSACSASSAEPSHVLKAIGLDKGSTQSTLRFSFGRHTTKGDIIETLAQLQRLSSQKPPA